MGSAHPSPALGGRQSVLLIASLMLAIALAALDGLIVGTAMPTIVGSLGGLPLYGWPVSAYLLTSTTTVPTYGRLADMWARSRYSSLASRSSSSGRRSAGRPRR